MDGWGKYGQIFVSPQVGLVVGEAEHDSPKADELVRPNQYGVTLSRYNIRTEIAPAMHAAIYRFTFPKTNDGSILIDITHNIPLDIVPFVGEKFPKDLSALILLCARYRGTDSTPEVLAQGPTRFTSVRSLALSPPATAHGSMEKYHLPKMKNL